MKFLSSMPNLYNFMRDGISFDSLLKRYALTCDHVVFNRFGAPIGEGEFDSVGHFLAACALKQENYELARALGNDTRFSSIFIDMWDYVDDAGKLERTRYAFVDEATSKAIGDFAYSEVRRKKGLNADSYDFKLDEVKEIVGDLQADIGLNEYARCEGLGTMASYSDIVGRALGNLSKQPADNLIDLFDEPLLFPDLTSVPWDAVLELRSDRTAKEFRAFLERCVSSELDVEKIGKDLSNDIWRLVKEVEPSVGKAILTAIASNLPSPIIINPIGVGIGMKDVATARQIKRDFAHVFFIQKLQSKSQRKL
ncbi:hypothetical protein SAMN05421759_11776 [Roseivivax lentus]|uniref:Uncharacterized protein n=1 Tax=Roseivivax lentus TaxID=633194 RepID=A0A1N7PMT4_9RHOB|nr:hypothetical protein [Roseivivax lentus]SIT11866.1 hypothetical protein SAMN05421759_11776 [Roseivivax lentus]